MAIPWFPEPDRGTCSSARCTRHSAQAVLSRTPRPVSVPDSAARLPEDLFPRLLCEVERGRAPTCACSPEQKIAHAYEGTRDDEGKLAHARHWLRALYRGRSSRAS